jgi:hypothetical protein
METIVKHAQRLVYSLLYLMPSTYQKDSLQAAVVSVHRDVEYLKACQT